MLPLYLPLLGSEAFGLISFGISIWWLIDIFGKNMTPIWSREVASLRSAGKTKQCLWAVIRIQEYIYVPLCLLVIIFGRDIAGFFSTKLVFKEITPDVAVQCIYWMLVSVSLLGMRSAYGGILNGQQRFILNAGLLGYKAIWDSVGGYFVLRMTMGYPIAYFKWHCLGSGIMLTACFLMTWKGQFSRFLRIKVPSELLGNYRKLLGKGIVIAVLTALVFFAERYIVGSKLSVVELGTFSLILTPVALFSNLAGIITVQMLPRLTSCYNKESHQESRRLQKLGINLMVMLYSLAIAVIALNADYLVGIWLRNHLASVEVAKLLPVALIEGFILAVTAYLYDCHLSSGNINARMYSRLVKFIFTATISVLAVIEFGLFGFFIVRLFYGILEILLIISAWEFLPQWNHRKVLQMIFTMPLGVIGITLCVIYLRSKVALDLKWLENVIALGCSIFIWAAFLLLMKDMRDIMKKCNPWKKIAVR
jgi:O-antigen/teichoic acid export membrane protein